MASSQTKEVARGAPACLNVQYEPEGMASLELPVGVTPEQMVQRLERQLIANTLRRFQDNRERTARVLGLSRASLYRRLKEWGLAGQREQPC